MAKQYPFLIGGTRHKSAKTMEVRNPYNGEIVGLAYRPSPSDVEASIDAAVRVFEETRKMPSYRRSEILQ